MEIEEKEMFKEVRKAIKHAKVTHIVRGEQGDILKRYYDGVMFEFPFRMIEYVYEKETILLFNNNKIVYIDTANPEQMLYNICEAIDYVDDKKYPWVSYMQSEHLVDAQYSVFSYQDEILYTIYGKEIVDIVENICGIDDYYYNDRNLFLGLFYSHFGNLLEMTTDDIKIDVEYPEWKGLNKEEPLDKRIHLLKHRIIRTILLMLKAADKAKGRIPHGIITRKITVDKNDTADIAFVKEWLADVYDQCGNRYTFKNICEMFIVLVAKLYKYSDKQLDDIYVKHIVPAGKPAKPISDKQKEETVKFTAALADELRNAMMR